MRIASRFGQSGGAGSASPHYQQMLQQLTFELVPLASLDAAVDALPNAAPVSVTCSPTKGLDATIAIAESLAELGHKPIPHLAARMVKSHQHLATITARIEAADIDRVFLVAGDSEEPNGPFFDAVELMATLIATAPGIRHIGFTAYPDGHALISGGKLRTALLAKQQMLRDAGLTGHVSTQMCFSPETIRARIKAERAAGFELPVHLGVAGVVDRARLMSMGVRLGVGASLRYLKKNRVAVTKLLAPGSYEPSQLLDPLAAELERLGIAGIHAFTFNQVEATERWRQWAISSSQ